MPEIKRNGVFCMSTIKEELERIAKQHKGIIDPAVVVEFAKNKETALHARFCWDDTEAARNYRLWQARHIIAMEVTIIERNNKEVSIRAFHSLPADRTEGLGYRPIQGIMSDADMAADLLASAKEELRRLRNKYKILEIALSGVFGEIDKL